LVYYAYSNPFSAKRGFGYIGLYFKQQKMLPIKARRSISQYT